MSVDLPAPFSPTMPWISPCWTEKLTSFRATTPEKVLVMPEISADAAWFRHGQLPRARSVPPTPVGAHFRFLRLSMETAPMMTAPTTTVCQ